MILPPETLNKAACAYYGVIDQEVNDRQLHCEVDGTKEELRHFEHGRRKRLSGPAIEVLASYAVSEGVEPEDPQIRALTEATLAHWRDDYGINAVLKGPPRSTVSLIAVRYRGKLTGGWLWMSERDPGRSRLLGPHRLSSRAILRAIEVLLPHCTFSPFARGDEKWLDSRPSAAARFFHSAVSSFDSRITMKDINTVLKTHGGDLRRQVNAINAPRVK